MTVSTRGHSKSTLEQRRKRQELQEKAKQAFAHGSFATTSSNSARAENQLPKRFTVGFDYGATQTSVAYCVSDVDPETDHLIRPQDVKTIKNWPGDDLTAGNAEQVPTTSWYSEVPVDRFQDSVSSDESEDGGARAAETTSSSSAKKASSTGNSLGYLWGHQVLQHLYGKNTPLDPSRLIAQGTAKSALLDTKHTRDDRQVIDRQLEHLIRLNLVANIKDVIADFLTKVLEHTYDQLELYEGLHRGCHVEFSITVPTIFSAKSTRILQLCFQKAIRATKFGELSKECVDNLFFATEPQAGLISMIQGATAVVPGEVVTALDAGGMSVDVITCEIGKDYPLTLAKEVVRPDGDSCGATCLNRAFEKMVCDRLRHEEYLETSNGPRLSIANKLAWWTFENYHKKDLDIAAEPTGRFEIPNLRDDASRGLVGEDQKYFDKNVLRMMPDHYGKIFMPTLERVWNVLQKQLNDAILRKGRMIRKVFLMGGFSGSPSLTKSLWIYLDEYTKKHNLDYPITLISKKNVAAQARGAVLASRHKERGPRQYPQASVGYLRQVPHYFHPKAQYTVDPADGLKYTAVLDYFINLDKASPTVHEFPPVRMIHTFSEDEGFVCVEKIFISYTATESGQPRGSHVNRTAEEIRRVETDLTFLRDEAKIRQYFPGFRGHIMLTGIASQPYYRVAYDFVPIINGLVMGYEVRWSPSMLTDVDNMAEDGYDAGYVVLNAGQFSVAAAFKPGI